MKTRNANYSKLVRQRIQQHIAAEPTTRQCDECGEAPAKFVVKSGEVSFFFDLDGNLAGTENSVSPFTPIRYCCEDCAKNGYGDFMFRPLWPRKLTDVHG